MTAWIRNSPRLQLAFLPFHIPWGLVVFVRTSQKCLQRPLFGMSINVEDEYSVLMTIRAFLTAVPIQIQFFHHVVPCVQTDRHTLVTAVEEQISFAWIRNMFIQRASRPIRPVEVPAVISVVQVESFRGSRSLQTATKSPLAGSRLMDNGDSLDGNSGAGTACVQHSPPSDENALY